MLQSVAPPEREAFFALAVHSRVGEFIVSVMSKDCRQTSYTEKREQLSLSTKNDYKML